ncbi:MAG: hypothetical protein R2834_21635 [Rhodothermales bacterium]
MSSLIFSTDENQILVATDTLAVTPSGEPFMFVSKAVHIPHLRTIIAGTGAGGFANQWALIVSTRMVLRGIENLDFHTPDALRRLWREYRTEYEMLESLTTTVYQFGISEVTSKVVSFTYRSVNEFQSEQLQYGMGFKPECTPPEGSYELVQAIPGLMEEQRQIQSQVPAESRLYIGGEIQALYLNTEGCSSFKIGEFSDFGAHLNVIFENHAKGQR